MSTEESRNLLVPVEDVEVSSCPVRSLKECSTLLGHQERCQNRKGQPYVDTVVIQDCEKALHWCIDNIYRPGTWSKGTLMSVTREASTSKDSFLRGSKA